MRAWVLGSGTLLPHAERGSPSHALQVDDSFILLDCGAGTLKSLARLGLPWKDLSHLCISHFHTDHVGDLASILFALKHGLGGAREEPLNLLGPGGLGNHLIALARAHGPFILDPGFPLMVRELAPGESWENEGGSIRIDTHATHHTDGSLALRISSRDGVLGYTGDTGPAPGLGPFFKGCHVLISECSHPDDQGMTTHLTPAEVADLALRARPELLVTVHCYPPLDPDRVPGLVADGGFPGRVLPGRDGLGLDLRSGAVEVLQAGHL